MEIKFDASTITPSHLGGIVALMLACRTLTQESLAAVMAPHLPKSDAPSVTTDINLDAVPLSKLLNFFNHHRGALATDEITLLLADLNAELYSRRVIKPEDNPAAGVELPAAAVAGMDDKARHGAEAMARDFIKKEVIEPMVEAVGTLNLAGIFASAAGGSTSSDFKPTIIGVDPGAASDDIGTPTTQLDKNGLPWDSRIHAASKAINADGTWRQKRGVAPELVATVEAQLRGVMAVPVPDTHGSPELDEDAAKLEALAGPGAAGATLGEINFPGALREGAPITPPPPPPPAATVLPPPPPRSPEADHQAAMADVAARRASTDPTTFPELVAYITAQKVAGKLAQTQLDAALLAIGVQGALPVMAARPDLIPTLVAKLRVLAGDA